MSATARKLNFALFVSNNSRPQVNRSKIQLRIVVTYEGTNKRGQIIFL